MEWLNLLKDFFKNPIYFIFIAGAVFLFAPNEYKWFSCVLFAVVLASAVDFIWNKIKSKYKAGKDREEKKLVKQQNIAEALGRYDQLNDCARRIIDEAIKRDELYYHDEFRRYKVELKTLAVLGFAQDCGGDEIAFNTKYFSIIKNKFGKKIKEDAKKNE